MNSTLLDQFLAQDCTPYVRNLVKTGLEAAMLGTGPRTIRFELNRFEIVFDLEEGGVLIEDVLDASEAGVQRVPVADFLAALMRDA